MDALTANETKTLKRCEEAIERGLGSFLRVGKALLRIRDDRLYRAADATFEDYCLRRWCMSRPRAYALIAQAKAGEIESQAGIDLSRGARQTQPSVKEESAQIDAGGGPAGKEAQHEATGPAAGSNDAVRMAKLAARGMTSADRQEVVEAHEETIRRTAQSRREKEGRRDRLKQMERLFNRLRRLTEGLGDEAESAVAKLDEFWAEIESL